MLIFDYIRFCLYNSSMIKETDLTEEEKEKIVTYFGYLPEFHFYALVNIEEVNNIDAPKFAEKIGSDKTTKGKFSYIDNENYIATIGIRNNLYHEVAHLIFYNEMQKYFPVKEDYTRFFIDELIAEYHSTKLLGKSNIYIQYKINRIKNNMVYKPYLIGAYLAYSESSNEITTNAPSQIVEEAEKAKNALKFDREKIISLDYDLLKEVYKQQKTAP